ncbi:hypothetical protein L21SP2_1434 [Salinispira pacifica]|uniref:Uncharacterized protein n=1 Tax=Salinispira pacifica TaxID=1307761 RepID=V5WI36_9SPIO|nr:hypothetical protein L21SP2_1434 [Salinispira pacifica]
MRVSPPAFSSEVGAGAEKMEGGNLLPFFSCTVTSVIFYN